MHSISWTCIFVRQCHSSEGFPSDGREDDVNEVEESGHEGEHLGQRHRHTNKHRAKIHCLLYQGSMSVVSITPLELFYDDLFFAVLSVLRFKMLILKENIIY